jgi:hypothetical protein
VEEKVAVEATLQVQQELQTLVQVAVVLAVLVQFHLVQAVQV